MSNRRSRENGKPHILIRQSLKDKLMGVRMLAPCCFCWRSLPTKRLTLEHIIPWSQGGTWEIGNLALSCSTCNECRGIKDFKTFQAESR